MLHSEIQTYLIIWLRRSLLLMSFVVYFIIEKTEQILSVWKEYFQQLFYIKAKPLIRILGLLYFSLNFGPLISFCNNGSYLLKISIIATTFPLLGWPIVSLWPLKAKFEAPDVKGNINNAI